MASDLVRFKGMGDGVRINIDANADTFELIEILEEKIKENKSFFGDGNCNIRFDGRKFTEDEKSRFTEIIQKLLPLCRVSFHAEEKKRTPYSFRDKKEEPVRRSTYHDEKKYIEEDGFYSLLRTNRARLYQGFVHNGMTMRSDGHLILLGTVEKGGALAAVGNIIVIGGLYGTAHAGCNGHNGSYILAMDMKPERLQIASISAEYTYDELPPPEPVKEEAKHSLFDRLKRGKETEKMEEFIQKSEFQAVALVKSNKIELDNFTIQDFTNAKNVV